jgi:hypothetical protein
MGLSRGWRFFKSKVTAMKYRFDIVLSDFRCKHCRQFVSTNPMLSGVNNRNHCPYCLHSRHMDLYEAGDRLSACKAEMRPVGLTIKRTNKKYGKQQGELMLIHLCVDCGSISANRLAADDDAEILLAIFESSLHLDPQTRTRTAQAGIEVLQASDMDLVCTRLFGRDHCQEQVLSFA